MEKNKLTKLFWKSDEFSKPYFTVKDVKGLILDTIKVFGITNACPEIENECNFSIIKNCEGVYCIIPTEKFDRFDKYIIVAERVCNVNTIEVKSEDYNHYTETMSGDYRFVLNDNVKIED